MPRLAFAVAALPLALGACSAPRRGPLADAETTTTFAFLASRYDGDADGAITPAEYARSRDVFEKLDANADGALTPDDFPAERWERDLGIRDLPADARARMRARYEARAVVLAYFRALDHRGDPALTRDALAQAFARTTEPPHAR